MKLLLLFITLMLLQEAQAHLTGADLNVNQLTKQADKYFTCNTNKK